MRHDFRHSTWGHAMHMPNLNPDGDLEAMSHSTPVVRVGDEVMYETAYGYAVAEVIKATPYLDPPDMCRWTARVTERHLSETVRRLVAEGKVDKPPFAVVD